MKGQKRTVLEEISPEAKLICGLIGKEVALSSAQRLLEDAFGKIDTRSELINFDFTDYYEPEMGKDLLREWVSFEGTFLQPEIVRAKLKAIGMERDMAEADGRRRVNLDPGFVSGSKLVLASTKNFSHRIYLWGGIFAEVTLIFEHGSFIPMRWSYPDYRTDNAIKYFERTRELFLRLHEKELKSGKEKVR
ncbi:DUF4416 family protein [candidate division TA06 bacterium]|uniref:DUF4416 family protein n=1 Tax=candidate division TA06 bacterium TaxID=2250710 RepID=A0A523XET3_UNCT6|nr:MAG: DUF4416 family protein [candidate division TA06 bacterium]